MSTTLRLPGAAVEQVIAQAVAGFPAEICGVIGIDHGQYEVCPIRNVAASPETHYLMAPEELVQALVRFETQGLTLLCIYHSHPAGPARPSEADIAEVHYPEVVYLVVSFTNRDTPELTAWTIQHGQAHRAQLEVEV